MMKITRRKFGITSLVFALTICLPRIAGAITYDLKTDWSDSANPNGVWAFYQGNTLLPLQTDYFSDGGNWEGYAKQPYPNMGHVPVWLQVDGAWSGADFEVGDIAFHPTSTTSSTPGYEQSYVTWTSTIEGTISISGNVWYGESQMPRGVDWHLYLNSSELTYGSVSYNDAYSRAAPMTFTGGGFLDVHVGDVVRFEAATGSGYVYPWFIGVNLTIDAQPGTDVPEPAAMLLLSSGLFGLGRLKRRLKK